MFDEEEEYSSFIDTISAELKLSPSTHGFNNLGVAFYEINNYKNALIAFDNGTKLDPSNPIIFMNIAVIHYEQKNLVKAEKNYSKALEIAPNEASYWRTRADFFLQTDKLQEALLDLQKAEALAPKFKPTLDKIKKVKSLLNKSKKNWVQKLLKKN